MKLFFSQSNYDHTINQEQFGIPTVLDDLKKTLSELETAYARLNYVTDEDLIECYIYEVNSLLKRYKYLKEEAVRQGVLPQNQFSANEHLISKTKLYTEPTIWKLFQININIFFTIGKTCIDSLCVFHNRTVFVFTSDLVVCATQAFYHRPYIL